MYVHSNPPKYMKFTIFYNNDHTNIIILDPDITPRNVKKASNTFTLPPPYNISVPEKLTKLPKFILTLPRHMRTKLAQLRANKSPFLQSYLHKVNPDTYTPQCLTYTYDTNHCLTVVKYQHNTTQ